MQLLRVGSLNVNGLRDSGKRALLSEFFRLKDNNVIFLQETHSDPNNESELNLWWEGKSCLSHGTNISAGVAILFSANLDVNILSKVELEKGRLLIVKVEIHNQIFVFINIYAPNRGTDRAMLYRKLGDILKSFTLDEFIVVGGDWNCTLNFILDRNNEEPDSVSASYLKSVLVQNDFIDVWREKNNTLKQYTWTRVSQGRISAARLDRIYIKRKENNRVMECKIVPCCVSDHHFITVNIALTNQKCKSPYWKFNVALLKDQDFVEKFELFWSEWVSQKDDFESLIQWWEIGKTQIRVFCQQYTFLSTRKIKQQIAEIEQEIFKITSGMIQHSDPSFDGKLAEKKQDLETLLQVRAKGALIRSRFMSIHDMDAPTAYFFNLEKVFKKQNEMYCLTTPDGLKTCDSRKMRKIAVDFYSELYKKEDTDNGCTLQLLQQLPTITEEQSRTLDSALSFQELTEAVTQMSTGRSPGIDGLPVDFYKAFWKIIGRDFYEVVQKCFNDKLLPKSCQRAVLALLPKKGDLSLLKNWRPVSILTSDYKIIAKLLANRMKCVLGDIIHQDQSYCIPGRTIHDNIFLIRDILDYSKLYEENIGFLFLDQEKAFDRVDHGFLFETLHAFGFGNVFISWIKLLYMDVSSILKIGGGLSQPISIQKGIRQGCPLSGQLYALAVEPLLCLLRKELSGLRIGDDLHSVKLTAYADDITVIVKEQKDIDIINYSIGLYERASSAKLNWGKTEAFWCNEKTMPLPVIPENVRWEKIGFKFLGIFMGSENYQRKNWEGVRDKICARLSNWNWILPQLSYRGRVLVINNLAASILWHRLIALNPPEDFIGGVQKLFVNFFWSGQHWLRESVLYLQVHEGGQGLMDIKSKVAAFRLQTAQRLLYHQSQSWITVACALLNRVGWLNLDRHLFLMNLKEMDLSGLPPFYASVLNAWQIFTVKREFSETQIFWGLEEPLIFNSHIPSAILESRTVRASLVRAGVHKICHLRSNDQWITAEELALKTGIHSVRILQKLLAEIQVSFPVLPLKVEESENVFPKVSVAVDVGEWQEFEGSLLSFRTPELGFFNSTSKKALYWACVKYLNLRALKELPETKWTEYVEPGTSPKGSWRSLYKKPIEKRTGDLQWRISHWIIATNRYKARLNPLQEQECSFCGISETVFHIFIGCSRLKNLFGVLGELSCSFGFLFSNGLFVFWTKI